MKIQFASVFVNPKNNKVLKLQELEVKNGEILEGILKDDDGFCYPLINGIPRFHYDLENKDISKFINIYKKKHNIKEVGNNDIYQIATVKTFSDKWKRFENYGFDEKHKEFLFNWYVEKFGFKSIEELKSFYRGKKRILEVGPGSGFNVRFVAENTTGDIIAADISEAASIAYKNTINLSNVLVVQADLMEIPFKNDYFDCIIADGVLHHTPSTEMAVRRLYKKLSPGGHFFFYVYRKMGPVREFCDNFIRNHFIKYSPEECYKACEPITDLGRELSRINAKITLDKPIEVLGIPAGVHDVQRLFYYSVLKCFWNEAFDYETNNMVNYDWYHPHYAWKHKEEEIENWLTDLGCVEYRFNRSNPNGICVLLKKP